MGRRLPGIRPSIGREADRNDRGRPQPRRQARALGLDRDLRATQHAILECCPSTGRGARAGRRCAVAGSVCLGQPLPVGAGEPAGQPRRRPAGSAGSARRSVAQERCRCPRSQDGHRAGRLLLAVRHRRRGPCQPVGPASSPSASRSSRRTDLGRRLAPQPGEPPSLWPPTPTRRSSSTLSSASTKRPSDDGSRRGARIRTGGRSRTPSGGPHRRGRTSCLRCRDQAVKPS